MRLLLTWVIVQLMALCIALSAHAQASGAVSACLRHERFTATAPVYDKGFEKCNQILKANRPKTTLSPKQEQQDEDAVKTWQH